MDKDQIYKHSPGEQLAENIGKIALSKKAEDVLLIDIRAISTVADFFVITNGLSETHVRSIAEEIVKKLKEQDIHVWHVEGTPGSRWILLDLVDIVVHIFHPEARSFYQLEKLWGDAPIKRISDSNG
jgi:ribosome-associated protein